MNNWSESEIKTLINAVGKYGDNWDEISKEFDGKKTAQECVSQFIVLPIKEQVNYKSSEVNYSNINSKNYQISIKNNEDELENNKNKVKSDNKTTIINNNYITVNNHGNNQHQGNYNNEYSSNSNVKYDKNNIKYSCVKDQSNPIISQIVFFSEMFKKFVESDQRELIMKQNQIEKDKERINNELLLSNKMLGLSNNNLEDLNSNAKKDADNEEDLFYPYTENPDFSLNNIKDIIYKTYSKVIDNSKDQIDTNKTKIKGILDLLIHIQMKKIELKLEYFNEFDKVIEYEMSQLKGLECQIIQDRVKNSIKKVEISETYEKLKLAQQRANDQNH